MDFIDGHVSLNRDTVQERLGNAKDALGELKQICLVEFCGGSVVKKRNRGRKLVFDILADGFVGTLGEIGDFFEVTGVVPIVKNVKMIGFINLPVELCVENLVFSVVGKIDDLGKTHVYADQKKEKKEKAFFENSHVFSSVFT
jgi:hypothetical protein